MESPRSNSSAALYALRTAFMMKLYASDILCRSRVYWRDSGRGRNSLVRRGDPYEPAVLTLVGNVCPRHCKLRPDCNPNKGLEDLVLSCALTCPSYPPFRNEWDVALDNCRFLEKLLKNRGSKRHSILSPSWSLSFQHTLFEPKVIPGDGDELPVGISALPAQCTFDGWPKLSKQFMDRMAKLKGSYRVRPLPAYGRSGNLITPNNYEKDLKGACVIMDFVVHHLQTELVKGEKHDHFIAEIARIRVLTPPATGYCSYARPVPLQDSTGIPSLHEFRIPDE